MDSLSSLMTLNDSNGKFYLFILGIEISHPLFANLICMISIKYETKPIATSSNTNSSGDTASIPSSYFRHNLKNIKRKGCQGKKNLLNDDSGDENKDI